VVFARYSPLSRNAEIARRARPLVELDARLGGGR